VASHRRPKGTYTRNTPDWFGDDWCSIGFAIGFLNNDFNTQTWTVYNNDLLGRSIYIYGVSLVVEQGGGLWVVSQPGVVNGDEVASGVYLNTSRATAPGLLYFHNFPFNLTNPLLNDDIVNPSGCVGFYTPSNNLSPNVQYVVPANNAISFCSVGGSTQLAMQAWYVLLGGT